MRYLTPDEYDEHDFDEGFTIIDTWAQTRADEYKWEFDEAEAWLAEQDVPDWTGWDDEQ